MRVCRVCLEIWLLVVFAVWLFSCPKTLIKTLYFFENIIFVCLKTNCDVCRGISSRQVDEVSMQSCDVCHGISSRQVDEVLMQSWAM